MKYTISGRKDELKLSHVYSEEKVNKNNIKQEKMSANIIEKVIKKTDSILARMVFCTASW